MMKYERRQLPERERERGMALSLNPLLVEHTVAKLRD